MAPKNSIWDNNNKMDQNVWATFGLYLHNLINWALIRMHCGQLPWQHM